MARLLSPARECGFARLLEVDGGGGDAASHIRFESDRESGSVMDVTEQHQHEEGLAQFITSARRRRFRESLGSPKRRQKLRLQLAHFSDLDPRFTTRVPTPEQAAPALAARLRGKGAGDRCFLFSESSRLDGREMALVDALVDLVDGGSDEATFVSCVPGRLAYFHDEEPESRYRLEHQG